MACTSRLGANGSTACSGAFGPCSLLRFLLVRRARVAGALVDQLAPGGRLVMPIGSPDWVQELVKVTKRPDDTTTQQNLGGVRFVPLIGEEGWRDG